MKIGKIVKIAMLLTLLIACTSDATGPEGALELALSRARPMVEAGKAQVMPASRREGRLEIRFERHTLIVERRVDEDGQGRFRLSDERRVRAPAVADPQVETETEDGVESVFDGQKMAIRRRDGPWIERDTLDGLAARTLSDALGMGDFVVAALGDYLRLTPLAPGEARPAVIAGVAVSWYAVGLDPAVAPRPMAETELAALRDHVATVPQWVAALHRPTRVAGELAKTARGTVVAGTLMIDGVTPLPAGPATFALTYQMRVGALPAEADFTLPAERLPESRERPWLMIEDVLGEGLLPPYKVE